MKQPKPSVVETDPRFPSGPWTGFFLQPLIPGRHLMELRLSFSQGNITGSGRDWVGPFTIRGQYTLDDGKCYWTKRYVGKHDVYYKGYNEGKGIWGTWEIPPDQGFDGSWTGGFHIWPEGMADPTEPHLTEEADVPITIVEDEQELAPVGAGEPGRVSARSSASHGSRKRPEFCEPDRVSARSSASRIA